MARLAFGSRAYDAAGNAAARAALVARAENPAMRAVLQPPRALPVAGAGIEGRSMAIECARLFIQTATDNPEVEPWTAIS